MSTVLSLDRPGWPPPPNVSRHLQVQALDVAETLKGAPAWLIAVRLWRWRYLMRAARKWLGVHGEQALHEAARFGLEPALALALEERQPGTARHIYLAALLKADGPLWTALYHYWGLGSPAVEFADGVAAKLAIWRVRLR